MSYSSKLECFICGRRTPSEATLEFHLITHLPGLPSGSAQRCPICLKSLRTTVHLAVHLSVEHNRIEFCVCQKKMDVIREVFVEQAGELPKSDELRTSCIRKMAEHLKEVSTSEDIETHFTFHLMGQKKRLSVDEFNFPLGASTVRLLPGSGKTNFAIQQAAYHIKRGGSFSYVDTEAHPKRREP